MRFIVRHETFYGYSVPVQLARHTLRLNPRQSAVRLVARQLDVYPSPSTWLQRSDELHNDVTEIAFEGSTGELRIVSQFELDTLPVAPLEAALGVLPWTISAPDLVRYRHEHDPDPRVDRFARALAQQVAGAPLAFLDLLNSTLFDRTEQGPRLSGEAQPAAATLASWRGACRDLTVLFVACGRALGMPSRFCSGYLAPLDRSDTLRHLHAWPEVYLPGTGWRGWDPSQGQRVLDAYVPLCAAPTQADTMPVEGGFYFSGPSVTTTLDYDLRISVR